MRLWLKNLSDSQWAAVIAKDASTTLTSAQSEENTLLGATPLPASPLDWNTLISDAALEKILQAKKWLHPDVTEKTKNIVETALSYSHMYAS
jgi:hypothetical protein